MAKRRAPEEKDGVTGMPRLVEVTLLPNPDAPERRLRVPTIQHARMHAAVALAVVAIGGAGVWLSGRPSVSHPRATSASLRPGPAGVAPAYGYSLRCVTVTLAGAGDSYARADFDRNYQCGRFDGYATAIFHRAAGRWRSVLDATTYACPTPALPETVQVRLGVCPKAH